MKNYNSLKSAVLEVNNCLEAFSNLAFNYMGELFIRNTHNFWWRKIRLSRNRTWSTSESKTSCLLNGFRLSCNSSELRKFRWGSLCRRCNCRWEKIQKSNCNFREKVKFHLLKKSTPFAARMRWRETSKVFSQHNEEWNCFRLRVAEIFVKTSVPN